ncbi:HD domain-containing protein [Microvirga lotononidis]|uniref:Putative HD superfamily hydrolase n=1 Tax=Microvirga lotononidis TaxID=864069 RepID=I4YUL4_9HYPH|nr:HD domain-containing protein [Microvirga lotononidis]EIM27656.1 putative HD superfamily hydrolase [Microvirga lotononidis]WQO28202.1 HD domain-containing protein [Microvirga lotononidis]
MTGDRLLGALEFLREAERLKGTLRSGFTSTGRQESTAEHTWRLCLMALVLSDEFEGVDLLHLIKLCIVHDLGEALSGDIPAILQTEGMDKSAQERADLQILTRALHPDKRDEILALWEEYEAASSPEAVLAKGLDKLETILQHNQGRNPADFDYAFNLGYGRKQTSAHPVLAGIRTVLDEETRARAEASKAG